MNKNPEERFGSDDTTKIQKHSFFEEIDWEAMKQLQVTPPIIPEIRDKYDVRHFEVGEPTSS